MILGGHIKDLYLGYHMNILQNMLFSPGPEKTMVLRVYHDRSTTSSIILTLICTETDFDVFDPPLLYNLVGHRIFI